MIPRTSRPSRAGPKVFQSVGLQLQRLPLLISQSLPIPCDEVQFCQAAVLTLTSGTMIANLKLASYDIIVQDTCFSPPSPGASSRSSSFCNFELQQVWVTPTEHS